MQMTRQTHEKRCFGQIIPKGILLANIQKKKTAIHMTKRASLSGNMVEAVLCCGEAGQLIERWIAKDLKLEQIFT